MKVKMKFQHKNYTIEPSHIYVAMFNTKTVTGLHLEIRRKPPVPFQPSTISNRFFYPN